MTTQLRDNQSTQVHLNMTRRHMRLSGLRKDTDFLITAIRPAFDELTTRRAATARKVEQREDALDMVLLLDLDLDNAVKTAFEKCAQHDRENPGARVQDSVFPDGKFSSITSANRAQEPDLVERLALRIESLGEAHPLFGLAADLKQKVDASRKALDAFQTAITEQKKAEAEEEIAQLGLRRQYENNYLDARRALGREAAERLFPRPSNRPAPDEPTAPQV